MRIEICGGIASGKTSLAKILTREGYVGVFEQFRKNPFYLSFYQDPRKYGFEAEVSFVLQHYHQIKTLSPKTRLLCCDFSFVLDRAYANVTLKKGDLFAFGSVVKRVERELLPPALVIHLACDSRTELDRIQKRARSAESAITVSYLRSLNASIRDQIKKLSARHRVIEFDSAANDFVHSPTIRRNTMMSIFKALRDTRPRV